MGPINLPSGREILTFLIIIFLIGGLLGWAIVSAISSNEYESDTLLEPTSIEIHTIDGVSDTTYIYEID